MTGAPPKVFISYSHDTIAHQERVLRFADRLRADGIDADIDQYYAAPPEGWPRWYERQIEAADFVLMVCTETYYRRVRGEEAPGKGLGVVWEAAIIRQLLYDAGAISTKFVPVFFSDASPEQIPTPIKTRTWYVIDTENGYNNLSRLLTDQPRVIRPPIRRSVGLAPRRDPLSLYIQRRGGPSPLYEAKVILVGFGSVGKTSLVKRLVHGMFDPHESITEGIEITDWELRLRIGETVRIHIWDFGGQEILHATHQCFLTQRTLYIMVLAGRQGREDAEAEYWLNLIDSVAADSPVIVVLNKIAQFPFNVNRRVLQQKFGRIHTFVETDCEDGTNLISLERCICHEIDLLPGIRDSFPAAWFSIKERLGTMQHDYLSFERYRAICADEGENDAIAQETLAGYLHGLGIALNYRDDPRLQDTHVLNPRWITDGIYRIITHQKIAHQRGELSLSDLDVILDRERYPRDKCAFIVELMRKYELCFRFPETEDRYLIPQLLNKEEPAEAEAFDHEQCLRFEYQYAAILPEGLLPRFIVRTYTLSNNQIRWRSGVVLVFEGNRALVKADSIDRRILVAVNGPASGRRRLLAVIRNDFERIHASYTFRPEEIVPAPRNPAVRIPYAKLIALERKGIPYTQEVVGDDVLQFSVKELIEGVDLERARPVVTAPQQPRRALRAFISYAHEDEDLRAELETHLKLFRRQGLLDLWHDRRIGAGEEWKEQINSNLESANLVLLLVSADFIASDYCYDRELVRAMELHAAKAARVIPIIVRDCKWDKAPLDRLQALPVDGRAVATWGPDRFSRDTAWKNVADGIEKILLELRPEN